MSAQHPLLVTWSPTRTTVLDPITRRETDDFEPGHRGRPAVVAIAQRSSFVRAVPIPALSPEESAKMLAFKLPSLLPLAPNEMVWGFRIGSERGDGRLAIVGAIKADALRQIYEQAAESGIKVHTVLPLAFGSWLAARAHGLTDCAVVASTSDSLTIDIVAGGELRYSRSVPLPEVPEDAEEEIATTFCIAKLPPAKVLSLASPDIPGDIADPRSAIDYLGEPRSLRRTLFSLELPEKVLARTARAQRATAQRALLAAIVAVGIGAFAVQNRESARTKLIDEDVTRQGTLKTALARSKSEETRSAQYLQGKQILMHAFLPAQNFSDVVTSLGGTTPGDCWLTGITLERGKSMLLRGESLKGQSVSKFVDKLASDPRFRDVKLVFGTKAMIGTKPVIQFGISAHVVGNFALDVAPTGDKIR